MSQFFQNASSASGVVDSVTGTNGVTASPTTGNVVVSGLNATTSSVGVASFNPAQFSVTAGEVSLLGSNDLHVSQYIVNSNANSGGNYSTIASAYAAAVAAGEPATVFVVPGATGIYTENITAHPNINISAFNTDATTPSVTIAGQINYSLAGSFSISGINLLPVGTGHSLNITGSAASVVNLIKCNIETSPGNPNLLLNSLSASSVLNLFECTGNIGETGIITATGGTLNIFNCSFTNLNGNLAGISCSENLNMYNTSIDGTISDGNSISAILNIYNSVIDCSLINDIALDQLTTSTASIYNTVLKSGSATACESNGTTNLVYCTINSSASYAISGSGTLNYSYLTFTGSSSSVSISTQNAYTTLPSFSGSPTYFQAYRSSNQTIAAGNTTTTIIFDSVTDNVGSAYNTSTGIFTAPSTGFYSFSCTVLFDNLNNVTAASEIIISYTGSVQSLRLADFGITSAKLSISIIFSVSWSIPMTAGDTIKMQPFVDGTGNYTIDGGSISSSPFNTLSTFSGFRVA